MSKGKGDRDILDDGVDGQCIIAVVGEQPDSVSRATVVELLSELLRRRAMQ